jgi:hypothetical protein
MFTRPEILLNEHPEYHETAQHDILILLFPTEQWEGEILVLPHFQNIRLLKAGPSGLKTRTTSAFIPILKWT